MLSWISSISSRHSSYCSCPGAPNDAAGKDKFTVGELIVCEMFVPLATGEFITFPACAVSVDDGCPTAGCVNHGKCGNPEIILAQKSKARPTVGVAGMPSLVKTTNCLVVELKPRPANLRLS